MELIDFVKVISRQATINIGTIGHVAHGKSTLVKAISGVHTVKFKNELERNITIKLGYANAKIYRCSNIDCPRPGCYRSAGSSTPDRFPCERPGCGGQFTCVRHVSFVDCPGHDILMATMLNGAAVMDAAFLLVAGNEPCPQPQTSEHLAAVEIMQLQHLLILQNKVDIIKESQAREQYDQIKSFVQGTVADKAPVIPISAQLKYNVDLVCNEPCPQPQTSEHLAAVEIMQLQHLLILQNKVDIIKESQAREQYDQIKSFVQGTVADKAPVIPISAQLKYNVDLVCEYLCKKVPVPPRDFTSPARLIVIRSFDVNKPGSEVENLKGGVAGGSILRGILRVGQEIEVRPGIVSKSGDGKVQCRPIFSRIVSLFAEQNHLEYAVPGGNKGLFFHDLSSLYCQTLTSSDLFFCEERSKYISRDCCQFYFKFPVTSDLSVYLQIGEKIALSRRIEKHWRLIGWGTIRRGVTIEP
ncbi:unnamed protein product, partial [Strongylus vulgaris]